MGLYNEIRPKSWEDLIGDFSILQNELKLKKGPHAFLFAGPTGTGKTTASWLVGETIGATGFDAKYLNASDTNSIDDIRDLIEWSNYLPDGKCKLVVFDEAHKLSNAAWSALRIPTEEIQNYMYWIFCTSTPGKIPKDNIGRLSRINFPALTEDQIFNELVKVNTNHGFGVGNDIIAYIAETSQGSMRMALVSLESVSKLSKDSQKEYIKHNDMEGDPEIIELARDVYGTTTWNYISVKIKKLKEAGIEAETIRRTLLSYGTSMLLNNNYRGNIAQNFIGNLFDDGWPGLVLQIYHAKNTK